MAFIIELTSLIKMDLTTLFKTSFKKQPSGRSATILLRLREDQIDQIGSISQPSNRVRPRP